MRTGWRDGPLVASVGSAKSEEMAPTPSTLGGAPGTRPAPRHHARLTAERLDHAARAVDADRGDKNRQVDTGSAEAASCSRQRVSGPGRHTASRIRSLSEGPPTPFSI